MTEERGYEKVSLANLARGACVERFDAELERVLDNIADPNTKIKKARTITLKVSIVPTEDRSVGVVNIQAESKLVGLEPVDHTVQLVQQGKRQVAMQRTDVQGELFNDKVAPISGRAAKEG